MAEEHKKLKAVLQGNAKFTENLYNILAKEPGNILFSPIIIHAILSLTSQGAGGQTREDFTKVLAVPDLQIAAKGYKDVIRHLNSVKDVTLSLANKLFLRDDYDLQEKFKTVATECFFSRVQTLDFTQAEVAAESINSWVEEKTKKKITNVVDSSNLNDETRLVLINVIYFKGKWAMPFEMQTTSTERFYLNDNDTVNVQMMKTENDFSFKNFENLDAKVLELPYVNRNVSLIIILPNKRNGIAELEEKLEGVSLAKITEELYSSRTRTVRVSLPKFKIEQTIDLKDSLTKIGLGEIFQRSADFSGMSNNPLYVSKIIQKTFIEVNEEGTEATAAVEMESEQCCLKPLQKFLADHPFIIILQVKHEGVMNILFKGRILKPVY